MKKKRTHKQVLEDNEISEKINSKFFLENSEIKLNTKIKINSSIFNSKNKVPIVPESDLKYIENVAHKKEEAIDINNFFTSRNIFQMFLLFKDYFFKSIKTEDNKNIIELSLYNNTKLIIHFKLIFYNNEEKIEYLPIKLDINLKEDHNMFLDNLEIKKSSLPILLKQLRKYKNE
jgi:hypothetical protein